MFYKMALKARSLTEWQADKPLVCIHFGSVAASGQLPETSVLYRLLTTALTAAGAKGILLTGAYSASSAHWVLMQGDCIERHSEALV